jgi:hypothetical protein
MISFQAVASISQNVRLSEGLGGTRVTAKIRVHCSLALRLDHSEECFAY